MKFILGSIPNGDGVVVFVVSYLYRITLARGVSLCNTENNVHQRLQTLPPSCLKPLLSVIHLFLQAQSFP